MIWINLLCRIKYKTNYMLKKTFLEKLQGQNNVTYQCKENNIVIVFFKCEISKNTEVHILDSLHATSATVIGIKDLKKALKNYKLSK